MCCELNTPKQFPLYILRKQAVKKKKKESRLWKTLKRRRGEEDKEEEKQKFFKNLPQQIYLVIFLSYILFFSTFITNLEKESKNYFFTGYLLHASKGGHRKPAKYVKI
jgi:hypothetical protein